MPCKIVLDIKYRNPTSALELNHCSEIYTQWSLITETALNNVSKSKNVFESLFLNFEKSCSDGRRLFPSIIFSNVSYVVYKTI